MLQSWRWFGPTDPVSVSAVRQSGAEGIVSALHHIPAGVAWPVAEIHTRKAQIEDQLHDSALRWVVVESVPVHRSILIGERRRDQFIESFQETIRGIASTGIEVVCYNFMPVLDWIRTDLDYRLPDGSRALRFQGTALAAFDLYILQRRGAEDDYSDSTITGAEEYYRSLSDEGRDLLTRNILAGLPGADRSYDLEGFRKILEEFLGIGPEELRENLLYFQSSVVPVADALGVRLALHPDDPPSPLLGLPRVVSAPEDLMVLFAANPSPANGLTFCTGSFGSHPENDVEKMAREFADRIHFVHLRNVIRDGNGFVESGHLTGDVDMLEVVRAISNEEDRRRSIGRVDHEIPMRPDHGPLLLDDLDRRTLPGYSTIGRLKGLAELRGLELAVRRSETPSRAP